MELRQLEYFVAVAEEANFTRAAARVHVAQPGVSAQIRRLERELGQELFDRSGRAVRLTEVGAAVLPYARAALAAVTDVKLVVDELTGLVRGHVAVGMVTSYSRLDVADLLADFHAEHPAVEITLSTANSEHLVRSLQEGRLDLAVISLAGTNPPGLDLQVVVDEQLVAVVTPEDPLAALDSTTIEALRDRKLICLHRGTGLRAAVDEACPDAHIAFEASDPTILANLACRGLGVAIVPASLAGFYADRLHAITIPGLRGRLAIAWRADGPVGPAARALIGHARAALR
jgi:DNA-binding transcriptional LysR family regulator